MKKMMIAIAAISMIVSSSYAELVYDFTATIKTTTAKTATQSSVYSYYFGFAMNRNGEYWYTSKVFDITPDGKYLNWTYGEYYAEKLIKRTDSTTGRGTVQMSVFNKMSQEEKEAFIESIAEYGDYFYQDDLEKSVTEETYFYRAPDFDGEMETYRGKKQWCMSVKWSNKVVSQSCYRTPGTVKIVGKYHVYDCSGRGLWVADWSQNNSSPKDIVDSDGELIYDMSLLPTFIYQFGGITLEKSTRIEFVADIGNHIFADDCLKFINTPPILNLAGQGTCAKLKDKNGVVGDYGIQFVSGNITGVWIDPTCEICCGGNPDAVVFACDNYITLFDSNGFRFGRASKDITTYGSDNVEEPIWRCDFRDAGDRYANIWGTAAYGTFTLKYNQKESTH